MTDKYQAVVIDRLKMKEAQLDIGTEYIPQKPGCVKATVINLTSSEITIPKGKQLMEAVIFKAFNIPIDAI